MTDKLICTKEAPASPAYKETMYSGLVNIWNYTYDHPDAVSKCIDDVHDDYRYTCPNCRMFRIVEGYDY